MTWWCAARDTAWTWTWQAYPGVWILVAGLAAAYWTLARTAEDRAPRHVRLFGAGLAVLWLAADWPLGPLGAGYLVSVHTTQYLLFSMAVPPLLLAGTPPSVLRCALLARPVAPLARALARPLLAFAVFNVILLATHLPAFVDTLKATQIGSFAADMAWLFAGLVFWWQVLGPLPELRPLGYPGRIVFLLLNVFVPTVPAAFLTFADYPIYALYELAPPIGTITAVEDQQIAGLIMKTAGGFIIFGAASVLFFRWFAREGGVEGTR